MPIDVVLPVTVNIGVIILNVSNVTKLSEVILPVPSSLLIMIANLHEPENVGVTLKVNKPVPES
jgi:hypothetical protein